MKGAWPLVLALACYGREAASSPEPWTLAVHEARIIKVITRDLMKSPLQAYSSATAPNT